MIYRLLQFSSAAVLLFVLTVRFGQALRRHRGRMQALKASHAARMLLGLCPPCRGRGIIFPLIPAGHHFCCENCHGMGLFCDDPLHDHAFKPED